MEGVFLSAKRGVGVKSIECSSCPRISPRSAGVRFELWGAVVPAARLQGSHENSI